MNPSSPVNPLADGGDDARWFAREVQPHDAALRGYLRRSFPAVDAEEVLQESYLKLLKARACGRVAAIKPYLFAIARNTAINFFRHRRIFSDVPVSELPDWRVLDGEPDGADTRQRLQLVTAALDHLPSRCRAVLRLALLNGRDTAGIAAELGIAESTVRVQLARGLRKCAAYMRERGERR